MLIVWDEPKRPADLAKHGLDFAEFGEFFDFGSFKAFSAKPGRLGGARFVFIGIWNSEVVVAAIVSPLGSEALSLVSLRPASKKERRAYDSP